MKEYQPIVKNLRRISLRNRNFHAMEKFEMPLMTDVSHKSRVLGSVIRRPESPSSPDSPTRKQFFNKYLKEIIGNEQTSKSVHGHCGF